ncbi:hypothetical protein [Kutzneria sp. 744]|uniref:hypothetical protein n=1 Tax=Kutzneria sp. (strain 744) TaxID=345341 RepID=UPI0018DAFB90|nr:hypothetical protein [Kutzneria sp. 744]
MTARATQAAAAIDGEYKAAGVDAVADAAIARITPDNFLDHHALVRDVLGERRSAALLDIGAVD